MHRLARTPALVAVVIALTIVSVYASRYSDYESTDPEHRLSVVRMRAIVEVARIHAEATAEESDGAAAADRSRSSRLFERVSSWSRQLPERYRETIVTSDAWDGALYIGDVDGEPAVISFGPDGEADLLDGIRTIRRADDRRSEGEALTQLLKKNAESIEYRGSEADDLIVVGGEVVDAGTLVRSRARRTMADMRSLATAVETYSIDNNVYPHTAGGRSLTIDELAAEVEPVYIRTAPELDAWKRPFLYLGDASGYMIVSFGADQLPDVTYRWPMAPEELAASGATQRLDQDIVFMNGQFVAWPEGEQQ